MAIFLSETDVGRLLPMPAPLEAVEEGFRLLGRELPILASDQPSPGR